MISNGVDTFIHWLHVMSAILWVGGMIFAGWILTPIARTELPPQIRFPFYKKIGKRFYLLGWSALGTLVLTGLYKIAQIWDSWETLFHSSFGFLLSVKIVLVLLMLILSALHDFVWGPKLSEMSNHLSPEQYQKTLSRLSFWARVNVLLGIIIVFLGAMLRMNPF